MICATFYGKTLDESGKSWKGDRTEAIGDKAAIAIEVGGFEISRF
jgi:hypothetical protein